ncbi:MAG: hypothetical protein U9R52_04900, partial [Candidatus Omnitrophota bacterium]|nr:hypothetical protein [Candidatus Omnitrophota bacterium]
QRDENVIKTLGARGEKILKVREGELEYLENTSENRVKASCELTIGVPGQIDEELIKEKQELKTYSEQLKPLYAELNAEFALHKESKEEGSFDKDGWDKWSADWRKRLADIELIFKQRKQSTLYPALPEIERNLRKICDKLSILWGLYSNELEEGSSPFSYMLMSANPENLNSSIEKLFTKTTGELEPLKKEHHSCI